MLLQFTTDIYAIFSKHKHNHKRHRILETKLRTFTVPMEIEENRLVGIASFEVFVSILDTTTENSAFCGSKAKMKFHFNWFQILPRKEETFQDTLGQELMQN